MIGEISQTLERMEAAQDIVSTRGWAVVRIGIAGRDTAVALLERIGADLGGLVPHTAHRPIADVTTTEGFNDSERRPQSDNGPQFPHTDGVLSDELPAILVMACTGRAEEGGDSVLVDMRPFLAEHGPSGRLDPLFAPDAVAIIRGHMSKQVSVLRRRGRYVDVAFSDHEYNSATPHDSSAAAFAALRTYAGSDVQQDRILLADGDLLLVANRYCLHGREGFRNGPGGTRHLVRAWYRGGVARFGVFDGYVADW
jgi:alpha-ketoglutarate-dependent taurine dioxygenase